MTSTFGAAVKAWRDRLSVADTGLPATARRRATGLRREELASLAGLSVDYVIRLEQGRARNPSPQIVAALARALQLNGAERDHLYRTAGLLPPARNNPDQRLKQGGDYGRAVVLGEVGNQYRRTEGHGTVPPTSKQ